MAIPHAFPGMPVDLLSDAESRAEPGSTALVKHESFEAVRLVIPKGQVLPHHQVDGAITIQCVEGRIEFTCGDRAHDMRAGHWLFLEGGERHSLSGVEDAVVLLTIMFPRPGGGT